MNCRDCYNLNRAVFGRQFLIAPEATKQEEGMMSEGRIAPGVFEVNPNSSLDYKSAQVA